MINNPIIRENGMIDVNIKEKLGKIVTSTRGERRRTRQ